jgi:hypothetical protein
VVVPARPGMFEANGWNPRRVAAFYK